MPEMDSWMLQQQRQAWEADLPVFPVSREPSAPYEAASKSSSGPGSRRCCARGRAAACRSGLSTCRFSWSDLPSSHR